jgi:sugar phosphate isomerase/epimerase
MRVGLDGFALHPLKLDPFGMLDFARRRGFQGLLFGSLGTDPGRLREIRAHADRLGLFSFVSVSSPNFHALKSNSAERVRRLEEEIERAAACGWHELGANLGNEKTRFEDPRPWPEHEAAALQVLKGLRPVLKGCNSRINLEPHGECGVFELIRLVEQAGPDCAGICLDTANVLCFAEDPVAAARRAAPYTHLTHLQAKLSLRGGSKAARQGDSGRSQY